MYGAVALTVATILCAASPTLPKPKSGPDLKRPSTAILATPKPPDPLVTKEIKAELIKAQTTLTLSRYAATVSALERTLRLARAQAPLELSQLTVVDEIPEGLGMFKAAEGSRANGGTLRLYAEVRNFGLRDLDGGYEVQLVTDAYFYYEDGEFIAGTKGIGEHRFSATTRHDVTFMILELHTTGLPPQPYIVELFVTDKVSGKQSRTQVSFVVGPG